MAVQPSEDMRGFYEVGSSADRHDISARLAPVVADIKQTTGGDCATMGWGILGVAWLLTPTVNTVGRGTRLRDVAELTAGFAAGLVNATVLGSDLITQGESDPRSGVGLGTRPALPDALNEKLPQVMARAERTLREQLLMPNLVEVFLDLLAARGDFATKGLLPSLAVQLPGLDLAHAGVGQLACGAYFFEAGVQAAIAETAGRKRGRAHRRELTAATARDSGFVLLGALMLLAGDQCLAAAS